MRNPSNGRAVPWRRIDACNHVLGGAIGEVVRLRFLSPLTRREQETPTGCWDKILHATEIERSSRSS